MTTRKLIEFLRASAGRPFEWGQEDCCLLLANWWRANHGNDPAHWLRGTYDTREGKDSVLATNRGLQRLVSRIAGEAGAMRTRAPNTGDFGLIALGGRPYGAICTGRVADRVCWAVRSETGVTFLTNPRILRAWSINVGRNLEAAPTGQ